MVICHYDQDPSTTAGRTLQRSEARRTGTRDLPRRGHAARTRIHRQGLSAPSAATKGLDTATTPFPRQLPGAGTRLAVTCQRSRRSRLIVLCIDTNILLYAQNQDCPEHERAFEFVVSCGGREDVAVCELVLVELYILLRNPTVLQRPLSANQAATVCMAYRENPRWRLVENAPIMDQIWALASNTDFSRHRIFDARIALTLLHHGVTELATANVKDFGDFGFHSVWNPLRPGDSSKSR